MNMALQIQKLFLASIFVIISILCIGMLTKTANAQEIDEVEQIVTVKSVVAKGQLVTADNLKLIDSNRSTISEKIITNIKDAENLEALRNLRPGNPIQFSYLRERPMVRKNINAKAIFYKPGLKLESEVLILEDGNKDDIVKAKNLKSNQIINATVVSDNLVTVN